MPPKSQPESGAVQKGAPYFVLPSVSEASLTSFGMTLHEETPRLTPRGDSGGLRKNIFETALSESL
jgi:hypothetical protein